MSKSFEDITYIRSYRDLNVDFRNNPITKDVYAVKNEAAITQALKNLVQTRFGERLMQPTIGSSVYDMLFEPLDVFSGIELQSRILATIKNYEPRVEVSEVQVAISDDEQSAVVLVTYRIIGEPQIITNQFILERPSS
jgi:phage baseplate assembly protein W